MVWIMAIATVILYFLDYPLMAMLTGYLALIADMIRNFYHGMVTSPLAILLLAVTLALSFFYLDEKQGLLVNIGISWGLAYVLVHIALPVIFATISGCTYLFLRLIGKMK